MSKWLGFKHPFQIVLSVLDKLQIMDAGDWSLLHMHCHDNTHDYLW
jgi:hypothetical protein